MTKDEVILKVQSLNKLAPKGVSYVVTFSIYNWIIWRTDKDVMKIYEVVRKEQQEEVSEQIDCDEQSPPYIWSIVLLASIAFWAVVVWFALS